MYVRILAFNGTHFEASAVSNCSNNYVLYINFNVLIIIVNILKVPLSYALSHTLEYTNIVFSQVQGVIIVVL